MLTTRKNQSIKALQSAMAKDKKRSARALLEWEIACNTNPQRGHVYDQHEINELYSRHSFKCEHGATKICHLENHFGREFKYIVIKRFRHDGSIINGVNQLNAEIDCWQKYAELPEADMLCPILKFFTSKSDKVAKTSKTMRENVVIIAQRAVYVADAKTACLKAEQLNRENGYKGENAALRLGKLQEMADSNSWWDAMRNPGNSGVIFDYAKNCYKAVFIDYAL